MSRLREDWHVARAAHTELLSLGLPRVNIYITGSEGVVAYLIDALLPDLREPVGRWCPGEQLLLPPPRLIGTMIFQEIGTMQPADQQRLIQWLADAAGRTQVISTSSTPLLRQVEAGRLSETLYYRLNTICIDATR